MVIQIKKYGHILLIIMEAIDAIFVDLLRPGLVLIAPGFTGT